MECRLVLNNRTDNEIKNKDMSGILHQQLKYFKFRRVTSKTGKSIFYLFFRKEEETYFALRKAKSIKNISLARYRPPNSIESELPFRPFPPKQFIDLVNAAFGKYIDRFLDVKFFKIFIRRLSEQIMAQNIKIFENPNNGIHCFASSSDYYTNNTANDSTSAGSGH
ncbi:unnamed protein product [Rotaria socialis]|uniref:Uncharacterized protein n=1 Tax=Rotaria socialis TaxID=392032 RepID=A0A820UJ94_9BILA|nr:unnamed protein product [Rotaria socialis]CAF4484359.1 unnamed protein product [Rotaria socialis]